LGGTTSFSQILRKLDEGFRSFHAKAYWNSSQDHESASARYEPEYYEHGNVHATSHTRARYDKENRTLLERLVLYTWLQIEDFTKVIPHFLPKLSANMGRLSVPMKPPT
jgi:hypothetical protein